MSPSPTRNRSQVGGFNALADHRLQLVGFFIQKQNGKFFRSDQIDDDFRDDLQDLSKSSVEWS